MSMVTTRILVVASERVIVIKSIVLNEITNKVLKMSPELTVNNSKHGDFTIKVIPYQAKLYGMKFSSA